VTIGNQTWMAENLKVTKYRNGESIDKVTDNTAWGALSTGAYCNLDNDDTNADTYGSLYNWYSVDDYRNIAPVGWHVPTDDEWKNLEIYLGMSQSEADGSGYYRGTVEGRMLKSTTGWTNEGNGTDEYSFTALPTGARATVGYGYYGDDSRLWTSTPTDDNNAWSRNMHYSSDKIARSNTDKTHGHAIRCVKNAPTYVEIPQNLDATSGDTQVILDWADTDEADLAKYRVYRGTVPAVYSLHDSLTAGEPITSAYVDNNVSNGTTYYYVVKAVDADGNVSDASNEASATPTIVPDGLVAWYPFNNTSNDATGNGNDGVNNGATPTPDRFDNANSAYQFDGTDDYMEIADSDSLDPDGGDFTVSGWFKTWSKPAAGSVYLISKYQEPLYDQWYSAIDSDGYLQSGFGEGTNQTNTMSWDATTTAQSNYTDFEWHFFTQTLDWGNLARLYVDGVLRDSAAASPTGDFNSTQALLFGARWDGTPAAADLFNGTLDDIRLYNRQLSQDEISTLFSEDGWDPTPKNPQNLTATAENEAVMLTWDANPEADIAGYHIYRDIMDPASTPLTTVSGSPPNNYYHDTGRQNGTPYYYRIKAVDAADQVSDYSQSAFATPDAFSAVSEGDLVTSGGYSVGSAWADYDNDGDLDLYITNASSQANALYRNEGDGSFYRIPMGAVVNETLNAYGACWGDYDNDGDEDLFIANYDANNSLFRNNGDGGFTAIPTGSIVTDGGSSFGAAWADYDNDGNLDICVANTGSQGNFLYTGNGDGTFNKVTTGAVVSDGGNSYGVSWVDYDGDGDIDLYITNSNTTNFLYDNDGEGSLTRNTSAGLMATENLNSIGAVWADFDNDEDLDLFVANNGQNNAYYTNNGDGTFTKRTSGAIVSDGEDCNGATSGDYDNDGDIDIYVANYTDHQNMLYENDGAGNFTRIMTSAPTLTEASSQSTSMADYDGDGDLDILVQNYSDM
ncbi:MAG: FG-GAP-like repeat-containing protein, partial [Candidatus Marinimicrobia bacterium]|nr:FG-GAP-like repeat-containing protein [Candidatus Neomarinimicrobiota bacterium]